MVCQDEAIKGPKGRVPRDSQRDDYYRKEGVPKAPETLDEVAGLPPTLPTLTLQLLRQERMFDPTSYWPYFR